MKLEEEINKLEQDLNDAKKNKEWDVPKDSPIDFFDPELSYELTGYKPITKTRSLDFDPSWFTETRDTFNRTGEYCKYPRGSKHFDTFWKELYRRCKYGMTVNGYTITGDHYFFLNFYRLKDLVNVSEAGEGRLDIFPNFLEGQYQWFHYLKLAKKLKLNACMMKARGVGYSEIEASIIVNSYTVIRGSINVCCAFADNQLSKLLEKINECISFIDQNAIGFSHGRITDTANLKRSGQYRMINGSKVPTGWKSQIQSIIVDKPGKLRGDRTDILMFEEIGLWPNFTKAYTQADALVGQIGSQWGLRLLGGTGGESGAAMAGLRKIYYNPKLYGVLPCRHKYTLHNDLVITSFFLPAFKSIKETWLLDNRGYISDEDGRKHFEKIRLLKSSDPEEYVQYCAEFCFNAEEAFSLEGDNKFNKILLAELLTKIRALKIGPRPVAGRLMPIYKNESCKFSDIDGFSWIPDKNSKLKILEHPIWSDLYKEQLQKEMKNTIAKGNKYEDEIKQYERMDNLYIAGVDGIDIGAALTSNATKDPSDFCIVIKKRVFGLHDPCIVAIYKDRPQDVHTAYKIAMCLCKYYNAVINVEATRVGFLNWAKKEGTLSYFMRRPRATLSDIKRGNTKSYGTPATGVIIEMQTDLIATYIEDYCNTIWFEEILEELQLYNPSNKRKYDIVASLGMLELADQELSNRIPTKIESYVEEFLDFGYWRDERGYIHRGVIPKKEKQNIKYAEFREDRESYDPFLFETSDSRYHSMFIREGVYRTNTYQGFRT